MRDWAKFSQSFLLVCILGLGGIVWDGQKDLLNAIRNHVDQPGHREYIVWREFAEKRLEALEASQRELVAVVRDVRDFMKATATHGRP